MFLQASTPANPTATITEQPHVQPDPQALVPDIGIKSNQRGVSVN